MDKQKMEVTFMCEDIKEFEILLKEIGILKYPKEEGEIQ